MKGAHVEYVLPNGSVFVTKTTVLPVLGARVIALGTELGTIVSVEVRYAERDPDDGKERDLYRAQLR